MMIPCILTIAALTSVAFGFSDTSPVIAWSSTSSITLDSLPSQSQHDIRTLMQSLVDTEDICEYDAVILIEQPGLQAFDLRSLSTQSDLFRRVNSSPSARQYPHVYNHRDFGALDVARIVSSKCQSQSSQVSLGDISTSFENLTEKHVFAIVMPDLSESGKMRKDALAAHELLLSQKLDVLAGNFTNHFIILVGSPLPSLSAFLKRQAPIPSQGKYPMATNTTISLPGHGLLSKYQLLTAELITSLLVFFFIILPIVLYGIKALASIQNTIRIIDTTKSSFNALEKKNQ